MIQYYDYNEIIRKVVKLSQYLLLGDFGPNKTTVAGTSRAQIQGKNAHFELCHWWIH